MAGLIGPRAEHPIRDTVPLVIGRRPGVRRRHQVHARPVARVRVVTRVRVVVVMAHEPARFVGQVDLKPYRDAMATAAAPGKRTSARPRHERGWRYTIAQLLRWHP